MFYEAIQNNSGGYFIINENVGHFVFIEADSFREAEDKFGDIVEGYEEYCPCCGERWSLSNYNYYRHDSKEKALEDLRSSNWNYGRVAIFYFKDGTKEKIYI